MADNKCVVYVEPGKVSVEKIDYPKLELPTGVQGRDRKCRHGVILRIVATNICGSDLHMVRGRTTAPGGQTLGHEITGEIVELGSDVEFLEKGDLVSVPLRFLMKVLPANSCLTRMTSLPLDIVQPTSAGTD